MNSVELVGRLVADPELRYTQDNRAYVRVTIAVDRGISKEDKEAGKQSADFISCIFWNKTAENLAKYMKKGSQIGITGKLRTGSYEAQDGTTRYTTDVVADNVRFLSSKNSGGSDFADNMPDYSNGDNQGADLSEDPYKDLGSEVVLSDDDLPF